MRTVTSIAKTLAVRFERLSRDDLISFESHYRNKLNAAYNWNLWGAAYIINGGCSDDGFDSFCDWLISCGETVYNNALKDAESLAGVAPAFAAEFEAFRYVMLQVFEEKFDEAMPFDTALRRPSEPHGIAWREEELETRFPKLYAAYGQLNPEDFVEKWVSESKPESGFVKWLGILSVIGTLISIPMYIKKHHDRALINHIYDQMKTPEYFASSCEMEVKWYGHDLIPVDKIFKPEYQVYQNVRAKLPVQEDRDKSGRLRWKVEIETASDHFECIDYADQYNGDMSYKHEPILRKLSEN